MPEKQFSFHAGALLTLSPLVSLGLVGTHLVPTGDPELPTTVAAGLRAGPSEILLATFDLEADLSQRLGEALSSDSIFYDVHVGAQGMVSQHFPIRLGYYTHKVSDSKYLTVGVGLEGGKTRIGYSVRYPLSGEETLEGRHPLYHLFTMGVSMP